MDTTTSLNTYRISFTDWLREKYPDLKLHAWQIKVATYLLSRPIGAGKTLLLNLLVEYDKTAS